MIRRPPRSTLSSSSAASDVYKRQPVISYGGWPVKGVGGGALVRPAPHASRRCASLRDRMRPLTRGPLPLPVLGREKLRCAASRPGLATVSYTHLTLPTKRIV